MIGLYQLFLTLGLCFALSAKLGLLRNMEPGLPRQLFAAGLTFFIFTWIDFALWTLLGWGVVFELSSWGTRIAALFWVARDLSVGYTNSLDGLRARLRSAAHPGRWPMAFMFLALLVISRFWFGIVADQEGAVWSNFNFVDTAFHMSVAQAFLAAPKFPPMDLNADGFPLKYHFLSDFPLAFFSRHGASMIAVTAILNIFSAASVVGATWACFRSWLNISTKWVLLAALLFFFANLSLINLIHFSLLTPGYFNSEDIFGGIMLFPYFNFESHLNNLLEPQRGLLFSLPVILAILHICFGASSASNRLAVDSGQEDIVNERRRTLAAFAGICLMPFAHVVAFIMLVPCLLPRLWRERACWIRQPTGLLVFFVIGLAQLYYIQVYGPPLYQNYAAWDATQHMALRDFTFLPPPLPRLAFWIAVNGDFFLWGGLFALLAFTTGRVAPLIYIRLNPLRSFIHHWKIYFLVCIAAFVLINFFRYAPNWGDSNKFTFFLNMGLSLFIALGVANAGAVARPLFCFFLALTLFAPMWDFHAKIIREEARTHLLFHPHTRVAARWLDANLSRDARLVTAEATDAHFVTALTGRAVLAGIYSNTNPYVSQSLRASIRSIYEDANLNLLNDLNIDYIFISSHERSRYRLHSFWRQRMDDNESHSFSIGRPDDHNSVFIMDVKKLLDSQL